MKTDKLSKIMVASVIGLVGFAMAGTIAIATTHETNSKEQKILEQVSSESNTAIRDLRWARVALFDGQTDKAKTYLDEAQQNLVKVEKNAPKMVVTIKTKEQVGDKTISSKEVTETSDYIPVDAWLVVSEDYVATHEKDEKIEEANKQLKKGNKEKALDVLRSADIGVSVGRTLMPLQATVKHVDKAINLMKEQKYYEANLALKGAEDGLIVDSVMIVSPTPDDLAPAPKTEETKETKKG